MARLVDLKNYSHWNPFTTRVETTFVVGEPAILHVTMNGQHQRVQREVIITFEPPHTLVWGTTIGASFILKSQRCQTIEALNAQQTQYHTEQTFAGLLAPLVMILSRHDIQHGLDAVGAALKKYVEA